MKAASIAVAYIRQPRLSCRKRLPAMISMPMGVEHGVYYPTLLPKDAQHFPGVGRALAAVDEQATAFIEKVYPQ